MSTVLPRLDWCTFPNSAPLSCKSYLILRPLDQYAPMKNVFFLQPLNVDDFMGLFYLFDSYLKLHFMKSFFASFMHWASLKSREKLHFFVRVS